jgi:hypothetical protein
MRKTIYDSVEIAIESKGLKAKFKFFYTYTPGNPEVGPAYDHGGLPADPPELEINAIYWMDGVSSCGTLVTSMFDPTSDELYKMVLEAIEGIEDSWEKHLGPHTTVLRSEEPDR